MKKIILKVRQSGLMFNLNGQKFRSPVEIDISHMKIDPIISQMRSHGIMDYEISTIGDITKLVKSKSKDKNVENSKVIIIETNNDDINKLNLKIEKLEYMLNEIIDKNKDDNKEKEWEQNNKDVISLSNDDEKQNDDIEIDPNKKVIIEEIINNPEPKKICVDNSTPIEDKLSNKKVIIEELEDIDDVDIKIETKIESKIEEFKIKDFKYEEINEPFKLSSDIEKLKKYKK